MPKIDFKIIALLIYYVLNLMHNMKEVIIRGQYCRLRPCCVCPQDNVETLPFSPLHKMEMLYLPPTPRECRSNQILSPYKITSVQDGMKEL